MLGLFLFEVKKVLQLLKLFKKHEMSLDTNLIKCGLIKAANVAIEQCNHGYKIII